MATSASGREAQELGGLVWAWMGPKPAALLPRFEYLVGEQYDHDLTISNMPCNWLQIVENATDPIHNAYLHAIVAGEQFSNAFKAAPELDFPEMMRYLLGKLGRH